MNEEELAEFFEYVADNDILRFGEFTLKSKRKSPYFFNSGLFNSGAKIRTLAFAFAKTILEHRIAFDSIYGPAYKGIPLCVATTMELDRMGWNHGYTFNRKEAKDHGEGGNLVGAPVQQKRVVILDDVITSGMSIDESVMTVEQNGGKVVAVVVIVDRQERGLESKTSSVQDIQTKYKIPVYSILSFSDIIRLCPPKYKDAMMSYMEEYGV